MRGKTILYSTLHKKIILYKPKKCIIRSIGFFYNLLFEQLDRPLLELVSS